MVNAAIDGINWLISNINRIPGVSIGNVGKIPMLADGGTVWSGSAIVGEAGPELLTVSGGKAVVQPLSANTGRIEGLLGDINSQLAGGSGMETPFVVQVNLDGKVVGESAVQYIRRSDRGNGK
jgi:phage-related protein